MTAFLAVLTLDLKRIEAKRADLFCCLVDDKNSGKEKIDSETIHKIGSNIKRCNATNKFTTGEYQSHVIKNLWIDDFFENHWFKFLTNKYSRIIIILTFITCTCASIGIVLEQTRVGLDQDLSVPEDSYVKKFFEFEEEFLKVGAPVYFVISGQIDYSNVDIQNQICSTLGCKAGSMGQMVFEASKNAIYWKIEAASQSWIDDFIDWGDSGSVLSLTGPCCNCKGRCNDFEDFCPANNQEDKNPFIERPCRKCVGTRLPTRFYEYVSWFLRDNPGDQCAKSGHAAYTHSVHFVDENNVNSGIDASNFMTYESVCIYSEDCTENVKRARILADQVTEMLKENLGDLIPDDVYVFPYTLYTPYYEMYVTMGAEGLVLISLCFIPIFIVTTVFLGFNFLAGTICTITNMMITINTAAICALWNVQLNPLSIINYITGIGISVEFTSHLMSSYLSDSGLTRFDRVRSALKTMGPAISAGVTMTNLPGMIVLKFATAKIIEVYFFRMGFTLTIVGFLHGIIFLPVVLTYIGPRRNPALEFEHNSLDK